MKKELMTMEEKKNLDPNEMMENGLTRAQNEKIEKDGENITGVIGIFRLVIGLICMFYAVKLLMM